MRGENEEVESAEQTSNQAEKSTTPENNILDTQANEVAPVKTQNCLKLLK